MRLRAFTAGASFQAWRPAPSRTWHLKLMTLSLWCAKANRQSCTQRASVGDPAGGAVADYIPKGW